ncbi:MAG: SHOCT-like domain-containing protein [Armatimonadota bacterium]
MSEDRRRILDMLAQGKVTVAEAEQLLNAVGSAPAESAEAPAVKGKPRYLRVLVDDDSKGENTRVNIRVPLQLIRAGVKFSALMPKDTQDQMSDALEKKGMHFDLSQLSPESVDAFVEGLGDLTVNVDDDKTKVRVFCE